MKRIEISKWLKAVTVLIALMGIVFLVFLIPAGVKEFIQIYPGMKHLYGLAMGYIWFIAAECYGMIGCFWRVCNEIGKGNSFSKENAAYFVWISRIAVSIAVVLFAGTLCLGYFNWLNLEIAIILVAGMIGGTAISILAAALSHLILKAYEMKKENELTI